MSSPIDNQCLIGTVVDSNYWLHDILGAGSYGVVYKALDLRTSRDPVPTYWAIKVLQKAGRQPFELENIRREISLHMAMTLYPGIVTMYDVVDEDDRTFIILDLCDTGDLLEHIAVRGTYKDNEELLRMAFISLVDAVTACHMNNIAHRDLKPENILVNQDGSELFLTDFGLATTRSTISEFDASTGVYMSPESIGDLTSHVPFNPRTADIWSLGIILVNMLTGRYPWTKADRSDPAFAAYLADADYLSKWAPLSPAAVTLLRRMLNPDPLSRINLTALRRAVHALNTF
ncbi:kinase-like domain-containing protein, partial [Epithele typhae]|uniref:kinase-like domain-containing protein n=1 Tax=Epithele typhae TaxID=378194 RepID=UPI0020074924